MRRRVGAVPRSPAERADRFARCSPPICATRRSTSCATRSGAWGDSSAIQATFGLDLQPARRSARRASTRIEARVSAVLAAGGERLPPSVLKVLFPVSYWPLIRRYSAERNLDPYMIAALIAQESTFTADVRSSANAYGLMQILPSTGPAAAHGRCISPSRFSISDADDGRNQHQDGHRPTSRISVRQFGGVHYALATYNAGPNRVARWISERPGVDRDEFIDDIPFPETQGYVKKILGTAEDYRRLYAAGSAASAECRRDAGRVARGARRRPRRRRAPRSRRGERKKPAAKKPAVKTPSQRKGRARREASPQSGLNRGRRLRCRLNVRTVKP